jgi:hypothetical protein
MQGFTAPFGVHNLVEKPHEEQNTKSASLCGDIENQFQGVFQVLGC